MGSLSVGVADRWFREGGGPLAIAGFEIDAQVAAELRNTFALLCSELPDVTAEVVETDFISYASRVMRGRLIDTDRPRILDPFDLVVTNPPYGKLPVRSPSRLEVSELGAEVSNYYTAFLAVAARLLRTGGQLVAITPRSFANGPYFRAFRRDLLDLGAFKRIHVYDSRDLAFADGDVLQENVVFRLDRGVESSKVLVSASRGPGSTVMRERVISHDDLVRPSDPELFIHIAVDEEEAAIAHQMSALPATLSDLGLTVSTGRVVDFRAKAHLRPMPTATTAALIYPGHLRNGRVVWPVDGSKKPNAIEDCSDTSALLVPNETYVLTKRFTSKEERRRVVAFVSSPADIPGLNVGFENHTNVIHRKWRGLDAELAWGISVYLNSTFVDQAFRQFSGHTQVNATDLRKMRFPCEEDLRALGKQTLGILPAQAEVDHLVKELVR